MFSYSLAIRLVFVMASCEIDPICECGHTGIDVDIWAAILSQC